MCRHLWNAEVQCLGLQDHYHLRHRITLPWLLQRTHWLVRGLCHPIYSCSRFRQHPNPLSSCQNPPPECPALRLVLVPPPALLLRGSRHGSALEPSPCPLLRRVIPCLHNHLMHWPKLLMSSQSLSHRSAQMTRSLRTPCWSVIRALQALSSASVICLPAVASPAMVGAVKRRQFRVHAANCHHPAQPRQAKVSRALRCVWRLSPCGQHRLLRRSDRRTVTPSPCLVTTRTGLVLCHSLLPQPSNSKAVGLQRYLLFPKRLLVQSLSLRLPPSPRLRRCRCGRYLNPHGRTPLSLVIPRSRGQGRPGRPTLTSVWTMLLRHLCAVLLLRHPRSPRCHLVLREGSILSFLMRRL